MLILNIAKDLKKMQSAYVQTTQNHRLQTALMLFKKNSFFILLNLWFNIERKSLTWASQTKEVGGASVAHPPPVQIFCLPQAVNQEKAGLNRWTSITIGPHEVYCIRSWKIPEQSYFKNALQMQEKVQDVSFLCDAFIMWNMKSGIKAVISKLFKGLFQLSSDAVCQSHNTFPFESCLCTLPVS